jgi:predicted regulator of Ras-like GTPase activity (Roadblock/LC7/MglB family)
MVIHESDAEQINAVLTTFLGESGATEALLIDRSGQLLAMTGANRALDTVSISALAAGAFSSTGALAQLLGETEFTVLFHQGNKESMHVSTVDDQAILLAIFGERTTVGSNNTSETITWFNGVQNQVITATNGQFAEIIYRVNPQDFVNPNNPVPPPTVIHNALNNVPPRMGFAFGNRYELGYRDAGNGWMVGPYVGIQLSKNLIFDARAAWGQSDNQVNPIGLYTDSFSTDRMLARANLTGNW